MPRLTQNVSEVLLSQSSSTVRVSQYNLEVLIQRPIASASAVTGGGVSQYLIEVLVSQSSPNVRITNNIIEVLLCSTESFVSGPITTSWITIG
jgi:hypothetical protein